MKKLLLIAGAICFSAGLYAQKAPAKTKLSVTPLSAADFNIIDEVPTLAPSLTSSNPNRQNLNRGTSEITVIDIGTSANAYGLYGGGRTALWADPNLNSVAFFHRLSNPPAGPGSGYIGNDISTDGGATWSLNKVIYDPTIVPGANARFPEGVLVNPVGNTDPNNAFAVSISALLDGTNASAPGSWGGIGATISKLDGTGVSQQSWSTVKPFRNYIPSVITVNPVTGDVFAVDDSRIPVGEDYFYLDTLVITRGVITGDAIAWEQTLLYAPVNAYGTQVADVRIAFAPDGMTGYISTLSDNGEEDFATESAYYPILYKTTDGGLTWDEDAIVVALGGPDGLSAITNGLMDDEQWIAFWGEDAPERDEVIFTTAFNHDLVVDFNGNPVINVVIGVSGVHGANAQAYSILSASGYIASYNIHSRDGGETWMAEKLGNNLIRFRGEFGADKLPEDNRSQITTTYDGTKMFFSWLDTDFTEVESNINPDIYCIGWDVASNMYTEVVNVTFLSDAWWRAYMGTASYYALDAADGYIIPFVYQAMVLENSIANPTLPVQYKYIPDFKFTEAEFIRPGVKAIQNSVAGIEQNYPNPAKDFTSVKVTLIKSAKVSLEVYNIVGQKVYEIAARDLSEGTHQLDLNVKALKAGIYTYSVIANGERSTRKMMVN